jgi:hypothetical protein
MTPVTNVNTQEKSTTSIMNLIIITPEDLRPKSRPPASAGHLPNKALDGGHVGWHHQGPNTNAISTFFIEQAPLNRD